MKVMYMIYDGFDTQNGSNHLIIKTIDYLLNNNIEVYLLSSHTTGVNEDIPEVLKNRRGFTYDIVHRKSVKKNNFISRYLVGIKYAFSCKKVWSKKKKEIDAVILQSTHTAFFSSMLLKFFYKKSVVFNSFDVFPNVAYDCGALSNRLIYKILLKMQRKLYKNCSKIIVISEDMKKTIEGQNVSSDKIIEIKNWYDDNSVHLVDPLENKFIEKYNIPKDYFYVQYAGNIGVTFDYKYILKTAEILKDNSKIRFQIIGEGAYKEEFIAAANEKKLSNIDFYPWQDLKIISDVYSACDVSLIPLSKGVIKNSFPSKGSLLMACGKTIICATEEDSCYYSMINENKVGFCVPNNKPEAAAELIEELSRKSYILEKIGNNAKEFGSKYYSSSNNLPKFLEVLNEVCKEK